MTEKDELIQSTKIRNDQLFVFIGRRAGNRNETDVSVSYDLRCQPLFNEEVAKDIHGHNRKYRYDIGKPALYIRRVQ
jgi:hypothetical protein